MKFSSVLPAAGLSLLLAACASPPAEPIVASAAAAASAPTQTCSREFAIGTGIASTRCRSREQADAERRNAELASDEIRLRSTLSGAKADRR